MSSLAKYIDHTLLKPEATRQQIQEICTQAKKYGFHSVCVNPVWVKEAFKQVKNSNVKVCTVVGFPLGATTSEVKAFETKNAIKNGASEIDMVISIGKLKDGQYSEVQDDIQAVVKEAQEKAIVKVIIETCLLTREEKVKACEIAVKAGADFVKTSTGFSSSGATIEDVRLMRKVVGPNIGVKAAGGIRDKDTALKMIEAGASRIGASSSVAIVTGEA